MNLLNTLKKYFDKKTDAEKTVLPFTGANQVLDINSKFYTDEQLKALDVYCKTLSNFVTPKIYNIETTDDVNFANTLFNIIVIGKLVIFNGALYTRGTGAGIPAGENYFDLPVRLPPLQSQVMEDRYIRFSGDYHQIIYGVAKNNPNKLRFYTRDAIPTGQTININLCYVLNDEIDWTGA